MIGAALFYEFNIFGICRFMGYNIEAINGNHK